MTMGQFPVWASSVAANILCSWVGTSSIIISMGHPTSGLEEDIMFYCEEYLMIVCIEN